MNTARRRRVGLVGQRGRRLRLAWVALAWLPACAPGEVTITGLVTEAPTRSEGLAGATLELRDEGFDLVDTTLTGPDGAFALTAPAVASIFLAVGGDGDAPTIVFPGQSGRAEEFRVPDGQLWRFPADDLAAWRARFAGCPGVDGEGGMVLGEVRLDLGQEPLEAMGAPVEAFGFARLRLPGAQPGETEGDIEACYLDEEGVAVDPDAIRVGTTGQFAFFDVPEALRVLVVGRFVGGGGSLVTETLVRVPPGAVTVRLPAAVPL
jgi:hypothetical protein